MERLLLVEDKPSLGKMLKEALEAEKLDVEWATTGSEALRRLAEKRYALVLTDLKLPGADGIEVLRAVKEADADTAVIVMTAFGTIENAVEAMKLGAYEFIQKPLDLDYLQILIRRCLDLRALRYENLLLKEEFQKKSRLPPIIGDSPPIVAVSRQIQKVAPTESTVLLQGESGTGKELFARAVHKLSGRKDKPFVAINCAAIPDSLIENELFGHEKGSYTGAASRQLGKFELASSGTIFLDEIGELGIAVQSKILRVLQERKIERIGGLSTVDVDIRIICATNRDLAEEVKNGRFREDLFFRVNVFPITVPPLRMRRGDIDKLADHFLEKFSREMGKRLMKISDAARGRLRSYDWPGNIRELENCLERAVILAERNEIGPDDLNLGDRSNANELALRGAIDLTGSLEDVSRRAVEAVERLKIQETIDTSTSRAEAAERLGISYRTLLNKLRDYGIDGAGDQS
ncbi:MAG TPA: sigma-54 dependent transcriptional regulator [Thermoanaerobaculia bacterium]|nr:sigma-54 dependent transcriptional regulator [Thermoanaerobaculia bacterium]